MTIGTGQLNLLDQAKRTDPNGKTAVIVEMLAEKNEIIADMIVVEGNTQTGHRTTMRTGWPSIAWRQLNKGVQPSKSTTKQQDFTAGMIEARGEIEEKLVELAPDKMGFRLSENAPNIEAIGQKLAGEVFYGDSKVNPDGFTGLASIYSSLTEGDSKANVLDGGGRGSVNTSIFLTVWGENSVHGFFPKGTKAGISHVDKGLEPIRDSSGGTFYAYVDKYNADLGFCVRDWKQAGRICNIDVDDLNSAGDAQDASANLIKLMVKLKNKMRDLKAGKAVFYCNKEVLTALELKVMDKDNVYLTTETLANGLTMTRFLGIPIHQCDQILNTEETVTPAA
jgi:hypothetical protein